jgi:hypothetical protein
MSPQLLNAPRTLPQPETAAPPTPVEPDEEPYVLRSFVEYRGEKKVEALSVGDPEGVHYTVDLENGGLLYAWKGRFVDAGSMWYSRGQMQVATPLGQRITLTEGPVLAVLRSGSDPWPEAPGTFVRHGYTLDVDGLPQLSYTVEGLDVIDTLRPADNCHALLRRLEITGVAPVGQVRVRVAAGRIQERKPGVYDVDGTYFVTTPENAVVRSLSSAQEQLIPIMPTSSGAVAEYSIIW